MTSPEPCCSVELRGVSKRYGTVVALETLDLRLARGEFLTLLGPSGSGKTTILNMVAGVASPSTGQVMLEGRDVTEVAPRHRGLGMVFQNYALMPHLTVFENIAFPLRARGVPRHDIPGRVNAALSIVQLEEKADRKPNQLSGGQQQRVAIARALVYNPTTILMDEPLGALDKNLREELQLEIKRIHAKTKLTILYVTHDQNEALTMSDRIALMRDGRIEQIGSPNTLYFSPASAFVASFLGSSNVLDVMVEEAGPPIVVRAADGRRLLARSEQDFVRGPAKIVVRPENVTLGPSRDADAAVNSVEGNMIESMNNGGLIRHFVELADGTVMVCDELNRMDRPQIEKGSSVNLAWRPEDTLLVQP